MTPATVTFVEVCRPTAPSKQKRSTVELAETGCLSTLNFNVES